MMSKIKIVGPKVDKIKTTIDGEKNSRRRHLDMNALLNRQMV